MIPNGSHKNNEIRFVTIHEPQNSDIYVLYSPYRNFTHFHWISTKYDYDLYRLFALGPPDLELESDFLRFWAPASGFASNTLLKD